MIRVLFELTEWQNELTRLQHPAINAIKLSEMYQYVAVLLLPHTPGLRFGKTIDILRQSGSATPSLQRIRFIANNIRAFSATSCGPYGNMEWNL